MTLYDLAADSDAAREFWGRDERPWAEREADHRRRLAAWERAAAELPDAPGWGRCDRVAALLAAPQEGSDQEGSDAERR